jgi:hypothetical protein
MTALQKRGDFNTLRVGEIALPALRAGRAISPDSRDSF